MKKLLTLLRPETKVQVFTKNLNFQGKFISYNFNDDLLLIEAECPQLKDPEPFQQPQIDQDKPLITIRSGIAISKIEAINILIG